ncbi:MAG: CHAD domain-containing protein [Thermoanaerobaculia bacterium]
MAYALDRNEPISAAMPRIVTERVDLALEQLLDERETPAERIHNARKRFKESRAAVRLIRFALGDVYRVENAWFRDAGRRLAALRDMDAVLEATDELAVYADGYHDRRLIRRLRRRLAYRQRRVKKADLEQSIEATARELPVAKARVTLWPVIPDGFSAAGPGFRRTFGDGRRAFREAVETPSPESFHEWRKRVKDHWYHVQILRNVWPEFTGPYLKEIESLSDDLGDRHDLDVLRHTVVGLGDFGNDFELSVMHSLIDRRASRLSERAVASGARIYAETPGALHDQFERQSAIWSTGDDERPASASG